MPCTPLLLPPDGQLAATLDSAVFDRAHLRGLPELTACEPDRQAECSRLDSRRAFLSAAGAALFAFSVPAAAASAKGPLEFSPEDDEEIQGTAVQLPPSESAPAQPLRLGEIPSDFWLRPRELFLTRQGTREQIRVVYWRDGKLIPEGYWQACALMRDVRANKMTSMDPAVLDILRGILGYYAAWRYPHPLTVTSGFRTWETNKALMGKKDGEGAAKNSMHLYGRATDTYMTGISPRDIGALGMHLRQGGVGFYPAKGFTHLDTGRLRTWRG